MRYIKKFENEHQLDEHPEEGSHYMFFKNIESIKHYISEIEQISEEEIGQLLDNGHDWASDHIAVAKDNIQQVAEFLRNEDIMHMDEPNGINQKIPDYPEGINPAELIQDEENQDEIVETFKEFNRKK